jgi:hypothetical protein
MRGEAKVTLPQAYCISLPHGTVLWTLIVFTWVLFRLSVSFCLHWMANSSNVSLSTFVWSSANLVPKPLKCFVRTFCRLDSSFWMALTFQGQSSVSWRWWTFRTTKHQQNDRKYWKNLRSHSWRPFLNNPWALRHRLDLLQCLPGDLNRKFEHAQHCCEVCSPTLDKWSKAAARTCVSWATRDKRGPNFYI